MPIGWDRRITHYASDAVTEIGSISDRAILGCWFELHRQGGCGAGELRLRDEFPDRQTIQVGDWIACDVSDDDRWYFGRVESRESESPAGIRFRIEGASVELGEVFPGGFGLAADGVPPHRYARTDLFPHDPDRILETYDPIDTTTDLVRLLLQQYVAPSTHILYDSDLVIDSPYDGGLSSFKFRGEESIRSVLKDLAFRARHASWGVDSSRTFFFRPKFDELQMTVQEGVDVAKLEESCDREMLFNRVTLTGDYVYGDPVDSSGGYRSFFRWRGNYTQPESRLLHGERRIRLWIPWIRSNADARGFVREFFRVYAQPTTKYLIDLPNRHTLIRPWAGRVRLLDRTGNTLIETHVETIRVQFDHAPSFRLELGPEDPHTLWPEPSQDERWEPSNQGQGGDVTLTENSDATDPVSSSAMISSDFSSGDISSFDSSYDSSGSSVAASSDSSDSEFSSSNLPTSSGGGTSSSGIDSSHGGSESTSNAPTSESGETTSGSEWSSHPATDSNFSSDSHTTLSSMISDDTLSFASFGGTMTS